MSEFEENILLNDKHFSISDKVYTAKLETAGRTSYFVNYKIRSTSNANKYCQLHLGGELARVDSQQIYDEVK